LIVRNFADASKPEGFAINLIITTVSTTIVWLVVTFITRPEPITTLTTFYTRVRPSGGGWRPVAMAAGIEPKRGEIPRNAAMWACGVALVYGIMFATGSLILKEKTFLPWLALVIVSGALLIWLFRREDE